MAEEVTQKRSSVLRSASVVSVMTAISRVLGLAREIAMGYLFGTSALKSAFDMAFVVPNLFRRLFGEGALSSAFVPVFSETLTREGRAKAWRFASNILVGLTLTLSMVTAAGILLTFPLAQILPEGSRWLLPLPMLRIMLPYAVLICVAATVSGILNSLGVFAVTSLTPFLLNAIWILVLGIFILFPGLCTVKEDQMMILSAGILFAGLAQILFQLPSLKARGFHFFCGVRSLWQDPNVKKVLKLMGPAAFGMGLIQINVCIDKFLAFWADGSAPAALEYAERLTYLPLGMFGTAFMTVLLPTFSRQATERAYGEMSLTLERAVRQLGILMTPCSLGLLVLAPAVIQAIYTFKGGHFDASSITLSARALAAYAPGLLVFSLNKVMTPAFYGLQDMKTPVRVSLWCLLLNITLNISSIILLPVGWKHCGIAGSTVVTSLVNSLCLFLLLRGKIPPPRVREMFPSLLRSLSAAAAMAGVCLLVQALCIRGAGAAMGRKPVQLAVLGVTVLSGMLVYGGIMLLISRGELVEMARDLLNRKKRGSHGK